MLGRFAWFWFNKKHTLESLFPCIFLCHIQEPAKVIYFSFHICVQQTHITLTPTPEYVVLATKRNCCIQCIFYLCTSIGNRGKIRVGGSSIHITRVTEYIGSTP